MVFYVVFKEEEKKKPKRLFLLIGVLIKLLSSVCAHEFYESLQSDHFKNKKKEKEIKENFKRAKFSYRYARLNNLGRLGQLYNWQLTQR